MYWTELRLHLIQNATKTLKKQPTSSHLAALWTGDDRDKPSSSIHLFQVLLGWGQTHPTMGNAFAPPPLTNQNLSGLLETSPLGGMGFSPLKSDFISHFITFWTLQGLFSLKSYILISRQDD